MHADVIGRYCQQLRIVYVSSNPSTQARDIQLLSSKYDVAKVQPLDMFPQTSCGEYFTAHQKERLIDFCDWKGEIKISVSLTFIGKVMGMTLITEITGYFQVTEFKELDDYLASLRYAGIIQKALMPEPELLSSFFKDYFVLFLPRDIVSGDFYYVLRRHSYICVAAGDCTGHGVPGALLSILGISFLNDISRQELT